VRHGAGAVAVEVEQRPSRIFEPTFQAQPEQICVPRIETFPEPTRVALT
jgi:hypothetical protein